MIFKFKDGFRPHFPVDAQVVGERLEAIRRASGGQLTPAAVVADALRKDSPIHPCIDEWDVRKAAQLHWEEQARGLIRSIRVVIESEDPEDEPTVRLMYVATGTPQSGPCYITAAEVFSDEELRARVLRDALGQLRAWRSRYAHLIELSHIFEVIDAAEIDQLAEA